jgi:STE24 endopeptidase
MNEDKADRYHRLRRRARVGGAVLGAGLLAGFLVTGGSVWLRDLSESAAAAGPGPARAGLAVAVYVTLLFVAAEAFALPVAAYHGFFLEHRYGLGRQSLSSWLADSAKAALLGLVLALGASELVYLALRLSPSWWWLPSSAAFAGLTALITFAAPIVLLPLFFRFEPLGREGLRARLVDLAARAGTRVLGAYEWKLGAKSRAANAALVGLGRTRRIVVSDTLLAEYSDEEIEVILAHELAHHVHGDIRVMLLGDAALTCVAMLCGHLALRQFLAPLGLRGMGDVAGLPVLALAAGAVSLVTLPLVNAWSRRHERRADRYALDLTRNPEAFVSAMRRLGAQNLADEHPSRLVEWWFHSHPPLPQRIQAARLWAAGVPDPPIVAGR